MAEIEKKNAMDVILNPVASEKAIRMMEAENKLIFHVHLKASKTEVRTALHDAFGVNTSSIHTHIRNGKKFAIAQLKDSKAIDLATQLGII